MKIKIGKLLPGIKKNIPLKKYTTFRIGGKAKYFLEAKTSEDLMLAISTAKKFSLPFFILGAGSNLLISDRGYRGLVIKIKNQKLNIKNKKVNVGAGVLLSTLVYESIKNSLAGIEWAVGIPGTVGGSIFGNAGAFKKSMKNIIEEVEVFDKKSGKIKIFKNQDCKFGYRESIFKKDKNLIILSARIKLKKSSKEKIKSEIKEYSGNRRKTQPLNLPSIGSIFKNPKNFSAAGLIEKCNLKGKRVGNVKISEKHANFIVNLGNGKANEVKKLINSAKKAVKNKFGIILEEEIQYLP
ncbi:MAG: UDP-N-acetylmuramate dehydrogenase [Candidatus Pacebacteria bacterium]|nr:UDP-N-acetylmuramate dehydrogenase [Candidatus Paceibacterota bacterium]